MNGLETIGNVGEVAALDVGSQAAGDLNQIVDCHRYSHAERRRRDANFIVGCGGGNRKADHLPWRNKPRHHQRERERQHRPALQDGIVQRTVDRGDLGISERT